LFTLTQAHAIGHFRRTIDHRCVEQTTVHAITSRSNRCRKRDARGLDYTMVSLRYTGDAVVVVAISSNFCQDRHPTFRRMQDVTTPTADALRMQLGSRCTADEML
jgi:hypothetical protein